MIKEIEIKIHDKLLETWDFKDVFTYLNSENTWYPYVGFELIESNGEILDNCSNIRNYSFWLLIFQETPDVWREKAKNIMYELFEKIILTFESDSTLSGLVDSTEITDISMNDGLDDNKWKGIYGAITLKFNTTLDIT